MTSSQPAHTSSPVFGCCFYFIPAALKMQGFFQLRSHLYVSSKYGWLWDKKVNLITDFHYSFFKKRTIFDDVLQICCTAGFEKKEVPKTLVNQGLSGLVSQGKSLPLAPEKEILNSFAYEI